ncbi:sugar kinase, partial [Candidatus Woesearchaeota archaeon]|nr:sugar kinase [Candidatus Woesearchaeota archaeon]
MNLNKSQECKYDIVSLGALVHRLDSGTTPTRHARSFKVHVSGAEYNLAANACRYGLKTAVVTGMGDYCIGDMIREHVGTVGVDILGHTFPHTPWSGHHAAVYSHTPGGCMPNQIDYNRSNEAAVMLQPGMLDYKSIFEGGVRWVHTGGLFAALAPQMPELILEFFQEAKQRGAVISFDLNYREKLWKHHGGRQKAIDEITKLVGYVDVLFGNETDASNSLNIECNIKKQSCVDSKPFIETQQKLRDQFPNLEIIVTSLREEIDNNRHLWGAVASVCGEIYQVPAKEISVVCRIGGGDGLAGGYAAALIKGLSPKDALYAGWASGALVAS